MDKKKIDLKEFQIKTDEMDIGDGIIVKKRIPYSEKEHFAIEYIESTLSANRELGICYDTYSRNLVWNYLFIKYYTNIETDENVDLNALFDYAQSVGLMDGDTEYYVKDDADIILDIAYDYRESIVKMFEKTHSLEARVKELLSTDVDTNAAEVRELIEKLTDMKGALIEKEEASNVLSFGKKKSANVKAGGVKLNLAKK